MIASRTAKTRFRSRVGLVGLVLALLGTAGTALAGEPYLDRDGRPVGGYDVVSYHINDRPLEGLETITATYNDATWYFATEANRDLFLADPERYAPAYDGHCAYALADDRKVRSDPLAYRIVDGVLYMNFSPSIQERWERDIPGYLEQSEANWPDHEDEPAARPSRWF
ncbi:YHS domain-containing (seleno)protein [uncultured Maricaulis sp.]|uniref:YHS domain-containing (seleno)protein n=1 Tax=uncultured Maricaulis sp. TaxID=174710 RepID=UPI0026231530|nr:YHS domain-containing (seleno)protein [uncultured Maricaulis sp.]